MQVQFGGVASMHLDYDMAPYVNKSFVKHYLNGLEFIAEMNSQEIVDYLNNRLPGNVIFELKDIISILENKSIEDEFFKDLAKVYNYTHKMLNKEVKQSFQALYHNLNTLESRA